MKKPKLFLIDGNSFAYRAFYAIKQLSDSKGRPTNAVYGFITMLKKIREDYSPEYLAVAFDVKGPTFRHEKFKDYKVQRKPMPEGLVEQLPVIKEFMKAYRIPVFEKEGYEADDVLATLAEKGASEGLSVYVLTSDKDALQLVNDSIKVLNVYKDNGLLFDESKVKEIFKVPPSGIVDLIGLMGDKSDNIPGVPGIGEKTAIKLMEEFGGIDGLFENIESVSSDARRNMLKSHELDARFSRDLAVLDRDVPLDFDLRETEISEPDNDLLIGLFKEYEFKRLLAGAAPRRGLKTECRLVADAKAFEELIKRLKSSGSFAFDFETTGTDPVRAEPVGVSFCFEEGEAYYLPLMPYKGFNGIPEAGQSFAGLKKVFEDPDIKKIGQNIKYEILILLNKGIVLKGVSFDTMIASYLLNPSGYSHGLDSLAMEHLGITMIQISELIGKGKDQITMDRVPIEDICRYCCQDSDVTLRLRNLFAERLEDEGLSDLFESIEMPLVSILAGMEFKGIRLDTDILEDMSERLDGEIRSMESGIWKSAGEEFNLNSPKQLSHILFEVLGLPVVKKTKTGYSTNEEVLNKLAGIHELPKKILTFRELTKLKSTYVDSLPKLVNPATGRLHTSFNQTVTATGRLSSSQPNLQNIPVKTDIGREIRRAFICDDGCVLISADYSQIELRVLAHICGDDNLKRAFIKDEDIHTQTASLIFDAKAEDVTQEMRSVAKTVNFGIVYGISAYGLSRDLSIDIKEAQEFIDNYFDRYPGVKTYMDSTIREASERGYVSTIMNRKRYIPEITSKDVRLRQFGERMAINTPVQGSAADIIKKAMIDLTGMTDEMGICMSMLLQVHDELVFEVKRSETDKAVKIITEAMENVIDLTIPLKVNIKTGENWLCMKAAGSK